MKTDMAKMNDRKPHNNQPKCQPQRKFYARELKKKYTYVPNHVEHWIVPCVVGNEEKKRRRNGVNRMRSRATHTLGCANPFSSYINKITHINHGCGCQSMRLFLRQYNETD